MEFKTGDVVQLRSGGPAMTVGPRVNSDEVNVSWFNRASDGVFSRVNTSFPVAMLKEFK